MPDAASAQVKWMVTFVLYQPAPFGGVAAAAEMVGGVVSLIVTVKEPEAVNPPESVTEHPTVVVPMGKVLPEAGAHMGVGSGLSSASVEVAVNETAVPEEPVASAVILAGKVSMGGVLADEIVTFCVADIALKLVV